MNKSYFIYFFWVAVYHATTIIKLIVKSTGIISATSSALPLTTRRTPFATPTMAPVGPLMLSIHPGIGSFKAAVTMEGRTIAVGTSPCSSSNNFSAIAFVKVYVLGHFPNSLYTQKN